MCLYAYYMSHRLRRCIFLVIIIAAGFATAFTFLGGDRQQAQSQEPEWQQISLNELSDESSLVMPLANLIEQPTVIMLWADWCGRCARMVERMALAAQSHQGSVQFIVVNRGESVDALVDAWGRAGHASGTRFLTDSEDKLFGELKAFVMPELFFVNGDGRIRDRVRGELSHIEFERRIKRLIAPIK